MELNGDWREHTSIRMTIRIISLVIGEIGYFGVEGLLLLLLCIVLLFRLSVALALGIVLPALPHFRA